MTTRAKNPERIAADHLTFARLYAADGDARRAAIAIGIPEGKAGRVAARLMQNPAVRDEIQRLHAIRDRPFARHQVPSGGPDFEEKARNLSRDYIITALLENLDIALGKKPYLYSKVSVNALDEVEVEIEQRYKFDRKAADQTIRILFPEIEKL